jgi:phosphoenolpyruvate phosphomutase
MKKNRKLKEMFARCGLIRIVGAHNGLTARLVEQAGFDGVWASGLEIAASHSVPDANILTMKESLEAAQSMNDAVNIPVVADCDTGFGNSNNVIRMVEKYEAAGVAAVCIEDKKFPKVNSLLSGSRQELAPVAEFTGKVMAAKNAQISDEFLVIARVEALIAGWGEEEALMRAEKYVEAGADAILIHSRSGKYDEIVSFARKWGGKAPLVIVPTTYSSIMVEFSEEELQRLGIKMVIFANHGMRAAIAAVNDTLREIKRTGGVHTVEKKIASLEEVFHLQGMFDMKESEKKYLKKENEDVVVIIPAAGKPDGQDSIEPLIGDNPPCLIDINGRSLLERNLGVLKGLDIGNINLVTGYGKQGFSGLGYLRGVNILENDDFENSHILHSLMLAEKAMKDRTIVAYSDILFDSELIGRVIGLKADIVLIGDNTYKKYGARNKKLELIKVFETLSAGKREMNRGELLTVKCIGEELEEDAGDLEFVGIAYFSRKGVRMFRELYRKKKEEMERTERPFHEAGSFRQASFTDMVQELIDNGIEVKVFPVNSGWMEIHGAEDHKFACNSLKG